MAPLLFVFSSLLPSTLVPTCHDIAFQGGEKTRGGKTGVSNLEMVKSFALYQNFFCQIDRAFSLAIRLLKNTMDIFSAVTRSAGGGNVLFSRCESSASIAEVRLEHIYVFAQNSQGLSTLSRLSSRRNSCALIFLGSMKCFVRCG